MKSVSLAGSTLGTLILAMLFARGVGSNPAPRADGAASAEPTGTQQQSKTSNAGASSPEDDGPWRASRQYFAGRPGDACPSLPSKPESTSLATLNGVSLSLQANQHPVKAENRHSTRWCIPHGTRVAAMIAIVPDPVHSHLSLFFDRTIEALRLAAGAMNYVADRYWLPWQLQLDSQDDTVKQEKPGLLLFRWDGKPEDSAPKLLYVFLVSDTATQGINGTQFSQAVQYVQEVLAAGSHAAQCGKEDRVWIMGPTFSGSLASLQQLTFHGKNPALTNDRPGFSAYSGTISSSSAIASQNLQPVTTEISSGCAAKNKKGRNQRRRDVNQTATAASSTDPPSINESSGLPLTFTPLVTGSEDVVSLFLRELNKRGDISCGSSHRVEVAILSEAGTTYGGGAIKKPPEVKKVADEKTGNDGQTAQDDCAYASFRFPREISSLRNASAAIEPQTASSAQSGTGRLSSYLPFNLADRQPNSSDEPPSFARAQGPLSQEAVLMKFAAELHRGHYKYVGIVATNVLDVLFLAKFLRNACPDIRIFTLNADLLFERDLDNAPYIGTLSVSTYPLLSRSLNWIQEKPPLPRLPFADHYEEGQYNASLLAMRAALQLPEVKITLYEAGAPFVRRTGRIDLLPGDLPVWVTAVGTGGYWPVQVLTSSPKAGDSCPSPGQTHSDPIPGAHLDGQDFSPSWRTLALLLSGLALFQAAILCTAAPVGSRFREFSLLNAAPAQRFFFLNVASASLAFALTILAAPAWKFGMNAGRYVPMIGAVALLAAAVLVIVCLYLAFVLKRISDDPERKRPCQWSMVFSALIWVAAAAGAWFWWDLLGDDITHYGFFFGYRAVNLATGVSPLTPMLLLISAIFLWSLFDIWRLRFADRLRPRLNAANYLPGGRAEGEVANSINKYFLRPKYIAAFVIVLVAWLFSLQPNHPFQLFERSAFGRIYELLFCGVVALMLSSGLRLSQTWAQLHGLLQDLERSPIRHAFSRLKERGWSPIWQAGGQQQEWTYMVRSFEVMQQIRNCNSEKHFVLCQDITAALEKRDQIRKEMGSITAERSMASVRRLQKRFSELQGCLAVVLHDVWTLLQPYWNAQGDKLDEEDEGTRDGKSVVVNCREQQSDPELKDIHRLEEYAVLRYVAFIRGTLAHLRFWLILEAAVFSLVLLSLNVYSFEPHRSLIWSFTAIFVFIGVTAIQVLTQAHRDPIISRITGTQPNKLELQFFVRLATLGAVPLLTLLATHFPSLGRYLLSLLQPGMEALK